MTEEAIKNKIFPIKFVTQDMLKPMSSSFINVPC